LRLDLYLVMKNLTKTRSQASDFIQRGLVFVDGKVANKAGLEVSIDQDIQIKKETDFVSRAGDKLYQILSDFHISLHDKIIIDIGSSTGGFTDCSLKNGAQLIYAYDVGKNQMDESLKKDSRVILNEETNILDVRLPEADVILIDVSFTSILPIFKHIKGFQKEVIALIKPQYEAGNIRFKKGVLKDIKLHKEICTHILEEVTHLGFQIFDFKKSSLKGKSGNQEYLLYLKPSQKEFIIKKAIGEVVC
jgi:23S rRNA (cytidine1920-2'-O)/16S rRNA (cytidine1409-2'-O)-methyltransferase